MPAGCIREVRGVGTLRGCTLIKPESIGGDGRTPWPELGIELKNTSMENGLIIRIDPTWFTVCPV